MKRSLTLIGGILGIIGTGIYTVIAFLACMLIFDIQNAAQQFSMVLTAIMFLLLAVSIVALVLCAISITGFSCSREKFTKKRKVIITAIVFNMLISLYIIYTLATSKTMNFLLIVSFLLTLSSSILFIVDLCLEKKRLSKQTDTQLIEQSQNIEEKTENKNNQ